MQFDLFDRRGASEMSAILYAFPVARRSDLLSEIMRGLFSRDEKAGRRFWNSKVREIRRNLKSAGIASDEIEKQLSDLVRAVQIEIDYRADRWYMQG